MFAYGLIHMTHAFVMEGMEWFYMVVIIMCNVFSPAINIILGNMSYYNLPRESQSVCLPFCTAFANIGAMRGTGYSILFMTLFEDMKLRLFGITFVTPQVMTVVTGVFLIIYGVFVYFFNQKEEAAKKKEALTEA